jgi:uncharacterized protein (DUF2147 family)
MNNCASALFGLALVAAIGVDAPEAPIEPATIYGTWRNPKDTVHIAIHPCGSSACGDVIWATPKAQLDAQRASGKDLVGRRLFHDLSPTLAGPWLGNVFVPDLNVTLTGSAQPIDQNRLRARGCILGRLFCKSQIWWRVDDPSI